MSKTCIFLLLSNIYSVVDRLRIILKKSFEINNFCMSLFIALIYTAIYVLLRSNVDNDLSGVCSDKSLFLL